MTAHHASNSLAWYGRLRMYSINDWYYVYTYCAIPDIPYERDAVLYLVVQYVVIRVIIFSKV
jgi:hypothetical protein